MCQSNDINFTQMQEIQRELQEKYRAQWGGLSPDKGVSHLLWMLAEAGEAAQVVKKKGNAAIGSDPDVRRHFIEEMCDVMMYFNDVLLCYDITPKELAAVYREKHRVNMQRW